MSKPYINVETKRPITITKATKVTVDTVEFTIDDFREFIYKSIADLFNYSTYNTEIDVDIDWENNQAKVRLNRELG